MNKEPGKRPEGPFAGQHLMRADVERLIAEHGGPEGLNLREANLTEANLSALDLRGVILIGAKLLDAELWDASLQGADLRNAYLQDAALGNAQLEASLLARAHLNRAELWDANLKDASLLGADLRGAYLQNANLTGADLRYADLRGANFSSARLANAKLDGVILGTFIDDEIDRPEETTMAFVQWGPRYIVGEEASGEFERAEAVYRRLKEWYRQNGSYEIASEFAYRENEARRKLHGQRAKEEWRELVKSWHELTASVGTRWRQMLGR